MRIPEPPPGLNELFSEGGSPPETLLKLMASGVQQVVREINEKYLHWDKVKFHKVPEGLTSRQLWQAVKIARRAGQQLLPLSFNKQGRLLSYFSPPKHQEWIHRIDTQGGGSIGAPGLSALGDESDRYLYSSLMEEAIASSQLEGANTTRKVAKEMLRTKRKPRSDSERMILNNYKAILEVRDLKNEPLTPEVLCHLQGVLTKDTLNAEAVGRFRREEEIIEVVDGRTSEVLHIPPSASEMSWRIREICDFANQVSDPFVHPIVKASVLHFAIGYLHPFVDGNGRTARVIFYWYMLKSDYWLFEYFPISRVLVKAPAKYGKAYLHTETDGGDVTYFVRFHLQAVLEAMGDFHKYLDRETQESQKAARLLGSYPGLNIRQRAVISEYLKNPAHSCSFLSHEGKFQVTYPTARADLLGLEKAALLRMEKVGRAQVFYAAPNLRESLHLPPPDEFPGKTKVQNPIAKTIRRDAQKGPEADPNSPGKKDSPQEPGESPG
jgi:Fic family protein